MVFSNLQSHEKDAFFSLLDEYFSSRPEIFAQAGEFGGSNGSAASAVHRAISSNPEATSKFASAAFKHGMTKSNPGAGTSDTSPDSELLGSVAGRIAAFSSQNHNNNPQPHRTPPITNKSPGPNLVSTRKIGDVDTSSPQNMFSSVLNSSANKKAVHQPPPAPSAFPSKKNPFAPPPARQAEPPAPPQRPQPEEEEKEGEWAEALYDYDSTEAGDLNIKANQRVLVVERTSDDWWTGEFNGKRGLFPASYVQIL